MHSSESLRRPACEPSSNPAISSPSPSSFINGWRRFRRCFIRQDEIIPHLEPGRVPSTVDPDAVDPSEKGKAAAPKRPVKISAWKLAKLDSGEALKAAAKARASSSVLRPVGSHRRYDTDNGSSGAASSRSSSISVDIFHLRTSSPMKSSYPPSLTSREDLDAYPRTPSSFSSPRHGGAAVGSSSAWDRPPAGAGHFNRGYPLAIRSPLSSGMNDADSMASDDTEPEPIRAAAPPAMAGGLRSSIYWDQSLGRFVNSQSSYAGEAVFYGYPVQVNGGGWRSSGAAGHHRSLRHGGGAEGSRGSNQLPAFVPPRDFQE